MKKQLITLLALAAGVTAAYADTTTSNFKVKIQITKTCAVTAAPADIDLGSHAASGAAVNLVGNTTFKVNCTNGTPFNIGLAPSAANGGTNNGTGAMAGLTSGNTDKVPYTLYSDAGASTVWGNTATASAVGNGQSGTGAGMAAANAVSFTAYAKVTDVNYRPDNYADTVTVNVHY